MVVLVSVVLVVVAAVLFLSFYRMRKQAMSIFKRMGIPGPEPNFLFGNLLEFRTTPLFRRHQEWRKIYGETFGYFEGPTPVLVTSDVRLLQEVFIKQFNKFHARKLWPVQVDPDKDEDVHLFFARGKRWKRLRLVVNPAFSAAKIRKMAPTVNECINHLLDVISEAANRAADQTIELMELFRRLTLDTILRCEVGLDQNSVKNPDDPFLTHCKGVIDDTARMPWLYLLGFLFPSLHTIWIFLYKALHNFKFNPVYWLESRMREVVVMRRNIKENTRPDLMQQMLDAQFHVDSVHDLENEESKLKSPESSLTRTLKSMTNEEIVSHALLFLLAGYETTSTTLSYIFFELSRSPHVQDRLRHEVMTVLGRGHHKIDYDDLKKLTYLDYVIWETLRKYPLASTVTARRCVQDCTMGDLKIPAGMLVHANLWDVHHDPQHWGDDPDKFDPLRFMPERRRNRHPSAWMPFGSGPRSCAGLRFALLQLKMVVAKVLRDFDFQPSQHETLTLKEGATILPADGVRLATLRRRSAMSEQGLRRGSIMTGIPLSDWVGLRRDSVVDGQLDEDFGTLEELVRSEDRRDSESRGLGCEMNNRKNSWIRNPNFRRTSVLEDELLNQGFELLRKMSISKDQEVNRTDSTSRKSFSEERGKNRDNHFENFMTQKLKREEDVHLGIANMPTDIVGELPALRCRQVLRRGSAVPELESVTESVELETFSGRTTTHDKTMDLGVDGLTAGLAASGKRLYQRRGSG